MPEKLHLQIDLLERNPNLMWAGGNYITFLASSDRKGPRDSAGKSRKMMKGKDYFDDYFMAFASDIWGWTGTMIINRKALEKAGMFRTGQLRANDIDMWIRIANIYPNFGYISQPLATYHLEILDSISQKQVFLQWQEEFILRHLEIAKDHGRLEAFEPCATYLLRSWIRSMLFSAQAKEIRNLLSRFGYLLPGYFRAIMWTLTAFPKTTQTGCMMISKIVRTFNLRKRVVRRAPKRNENF
jgi:hypothetical protein